MTLSGTGLLAGTPTRSGTFMVSYQTRGTAPVTTGHSGTVLVKVTPASVSLSAGGQDTCLTRSDGTARCWGRNNYGQIGDGTLLGRDVPTRVIGKGWATISTSGSTTCGVKGDGTLWCWGLDNFGQVGIGRGAPVRLPHQLGVGRHWAGVSTAYSHTCATKTDGTLWCWGENLHGQLGLGTIDRSHGTPQRVGTRTDWESVTTGGWHACALTSAGAAYCWGGNDFGELGDGTVTTRTVPDAGRRRHVLAPAECRIGPDLRRDPGRGNDVLGVQPPGAVRAAATPPTPLSRSPSPATRSGPRSRPGTALPAASTARASCGAGATTGTASSDGRPPALSPRPRLS